MRITYALYLKRQILITKTHGDTQIHRYTHTDTHKDTQRHTHKDKYKGSDLDIILSLLGT